MRSPGPGVPDGRRVRFILNERFGEALASAHPYCATFAWRPPNPAAQAKPIYVGETLMGDLEAAALYKAFVKAKALPDNRTNVTAKDLVDLMPSARTPQ